MEEKTVSLQKNKNKQQPVNSHSIDQLDRSNQNKSNCNSNKNNKACEGYQPQPYMKSHKRSSNSLKSTGGKTYLNWMPGLGDDASMIILQDFLGLHEGTTSGF